ncbi:MAG: hypothetical protein WC895_01135 [Candidatus Shapirobacteria bacterium]|jgi:hypothetical protein
MYKRIITWKSTYNLSKRQKEEITENLRNVILVISIEDITEITYNTKWVARIIVIDSNGNQLTIHPKKPKYKGIEEKIILTGKEAIAHFFFRRKFPLPSIKQLTLSHQP